MEYAHNEGKDWRVPMQQWLEDELRCEVFNPNKESERFLQKHCTGENFRQLKTSDLPRYQELVSKIVDLDCREIAERSDFVICFWDESAMRGAGTKGELTIAKYFGKPVYLVTLMQSHEIPGWVLGCTTRMFLSFDELKLFLRQ